MVEKEKIILDAAIRLFSQNGFSNTSIQDIANESGIAKGTVYFYYSSKDELIIAVLNYFFQIIEDDLRKLNESQLDPREQFLSQISAFFEQLFKYRNFIDIQQHEFNDKSHESVKKIILQKQSNIQSFLKNGILSVYGNQVTIYLHDLSILLEGMIRTFTRILLLDGRDVKMKDIANYILDRLDDIVAGLLKSSASPFFSEIEIKQLMKKVDAYVENDMEKLNALIKKIKLALGDDSSYEDLVISIDVIEKEISTNNPRQAVIQGMLSNFKGVQMVEKSIRELKTVLNKLNIHVKN